MVRLPGAVLEAAVAHSRAAAAAAPSAGSPGFLQLDDAAEYDAAACTLVRVAGEPLEPGRTYRVALPYHSLNGMNRNQPLIDWANREPGAVPHSSLAQPLKDVVVRAACGRVWEQLLRRDFAAYDADRSGFLDREEIRRALADLAGGGAAVPDFMARALLPPPPLHAPLHAGQSGQKRSAHPPIRAPRGSRHPRFWITAAQGGGAWSHGHGNPETGGPCRRVRRLGASRPLSTRRPARRAGDQRYVPGGCRQRRRHRRQGVQRLLQLLHAGRPGPSPCPAISFSVLGPAGARGS